MLQEVINKKQGTSLEELSVFRFKEDFGFTQVFMASFCSCINYSHFYLWKITLYYGLKWVKKMLNSKCLNL